MIKKIYLLGILFLSMIVAGFSLPCSFENQYGGGVNFQQNSSIVGSQYNSYLIDLRENPNYNITFLSWLIGIPLPYDLKVTAFSKDSCLIGNAIDENIVTNTNIFIGADIILMPFSSLSQLQNNNNYTFVVHWYNGNDNTVYYHFFNVTTYNNPNYTYPAQCTANILLDNGYSYIDYSNSTEYTFNLNIDNIYYIGSDNQFNFEIDDTNFYYFRLGFPQQNYAYCIDYKNGGSSVGNFYYNTKSEYDNPFPYNVGSIWRSSFLLDNGNSESIDYNLGLNPQAELYIYTYHQDGDNGMNYGIIHKVSIRTEQNNTQNNSLFSGLIGLKELGTETGGFFSGLFLGGLIIVFFALISLSFIVFMLWKIANAISKAIPNLKNKKK